MKLYHYDLNGLYKWNDEARVDPKAGTPLIPTNATTVTPPSIPANKAAKWTRTGLSPNDGAWTIVDSPAYLAQQEALVKAAKDLQDKKLVVFYRSQNGRDTKVIDSARYKDAAHSGEIQRYGNSITDPSNAGVGYHVFDSDPNGFDARNARGIATKKIVNGVLMDRAPADIAKDSANAQFIYDECDAQVRALLKAVNGSDEDFTSHLMDMQSAQFTADNIDHSHSPLEVAAAKALLLAYKSALAQIQAVKGERDAKLALLEQE